ncbi:N-acetylmuramoyl-L-alanine amidase [Bradymonas sediminis]|uniref:Uncharacterized protein n=1 Tax=Bradymonas sediminis TaxID=1548548 RepID=A0A2Z4FQK6_9DELT|nr:N-acetylmuramoyl-L-alanine amidase [Bradymonas sediminis]AWV91233.1 hypothetical protein DN745_18635 [Bradymonas sediminis]TDP73800.1 N-acetylmuramoyl-L-alanine amidase [Bradymonas sediminis]
MKTLVNALNYRRRRSQARPRLATSLLVFGALLSPLSAQADPDFDPAQPEQARVLLGDSIGAFDHVGEELPADIIRHATDIHRARKLAQRRYYTATPGEGALSGLRLGMSAGHGIQWSSNVNRWAFQRGINEYSWGGLREDIQTNQIMIDFLLDMLERAGAETVTVRERNYGQIAKVIDNDAGSGYAETGSWQSGGGDGFGGTYRFATLDGGDASNAASATWTFEVSEDGEYPVYAYFLSSSNRTDAATYTVSHVGGQTSRTLSQADLRVESWPTADYPNNPPGSNATRAANDLWHYIGTFPFKKGVSYSVKLKNSGSSTDKVVIADALRVGAGEGFVKGGNGQPSGRPRWEEASTPYLEWLGVPDWMKVGDVSGRPLYAVYQGVDAYLALHTNAGGGSGTSTFSWYSGSWTRISNWPSGWANNNLPPGTVEWGDSIHAEIVRQIKTRWKSDWIDRGRISSNFGELRPFRQGWKNDRDAGRSNPLTIPAALVELVFHDSDSDGRYVREMEFRHDVARGMMAGIIYHFKGGNAQLPPLAPKSVRARVNGDTLEVNWKPKADTIYTNSDAASYRVYTSKDGLLFDPTPLEASGTSVSLPLDGCEPLYVRVTAVNAAGESLDSPVVGGAQAFESGARVLYVDGVERELKDVYSPNNPRTYARIYGPSIREARAGAGFDMTTKDAAGDAITGADYDVVVWALGETSTRNDTFSLADQQVLSEVLARGGRVLVSGAEIGWDLVEKGNAADKAFFKDALGASFVSDDADTTTVNASALGLGSMEFGDCSADAACIRWPDVLAAEAGGTVLLSYAAGEAGVESANGNSILVGFPLETIANADKRQEVISALVDRLLKDSGNSAGQCPASDPGEPEDPEDAGNGGDSGTPDAGESADGGTTPDTSDSNADAGMLPDGGSAGDTDLQKPRSATVNSGCGCASTGTGLPAEGLILGVIAGLIGLVRRRPLKSHRDN